jgi:hypothetical protein
MTSPTDAAGAPAKEARATSVEVTDEAVIVEIEDGRTLATPLAWYPRLVYGTPEERQNVRLIGGGTGMHWPDLDEDLSVRGMLAGRPSQEGPESLKRWKAARAQS